MNRQVINPESDKYSIKNRILQRISIDGFTGCWLWTGRIDRQGYGRLSLWYRDRGHYVPTLAHRLSYREFKQEKIDGLSVCHKCDTPSCVNPEHLFLGTQKVNVRDMISKNRGNGVSDVNRLKTHCNNGHALSGDNLRIEGKAKARRCRTCERDRKAKNA